MAVNTGLTLVAATAVALLAGCGSASTPTAAVGGEPVSETLAPFTVLTIPYGRSLTRLAI